MNPAGRIPVLLGEFVERCDDPSELVVGGPGFAGWLGGLEGFPSKVAIIRQENGVRLLSASSSSYSSIRI